MFGANVLDGPRLKIRPREPPENLQEDEAEAPHVGARAVALLRISHVGGSDFRGHVWGGAREDVASPGLEPKPRASGARQGVLGVAEIGEHGAPARVDEHVARLDVAVDDAKLAECRDGADLYKNVKGWVETMSRTRNLLVPGSIVDGLER